MSWSLTTFLPQVGPWMRVVDSLKVRVDESPGARFLIELVDLGGSKRLERYPLFSLVKY